MQKWLYLVAHPSNYLSDDQSSYVYDGTSIGPDLNDLLSRLGEEGWEMTAMRPGSVSTSSRAIAVAEDVFYFKRPR